MKQLVRRFQTLASPFQFRDYSQIIIGINTARTTTTTTTTIIGRCSHSVFLFVSVSISMTKNKKKVVQLKSL